MTDQVPTEDIERIVGVQRQQYHVLRLVSAEQRVYILHSIKCYEEVPDLRDCEFSTSLDDHGLVDDTDALMLWTEDVPIAVKLDENGFIVPKPVRPYILTRFEE